MNSVYRKNKARAIFNNTDPTETDQSQAHETDINVIVAKYGIAGQANGNPNQGEYLDSTSLPEDLRGFIEMGRTLEDRRAELPEEIREMPIEQILQLREPDIARILAPPDAPAPDNKKEET